MGIVVIDLLDAKVPRKDMMTASDVYVKIEIKSEDDITRRIGETKVIWDSDTPTFNETLKAEKISITSTIFFEIFDKDLMGPDDYIATVYAPIKNVLRDDLNHKKIKLNFKQPSNHDGKKNPPEEFFLNVKVSWIAYD